MNENEMQTDDKAIAAAYVLRRGLEGFAQGADTSQRVLYNDIIKYVTGAAVDSRKVEDALGSNLQVRRTYLRLIKEKQKFYMPKAAAASTEKMLTERESENFTIKVVSSRSQASQFYIILNLRHPQLVEDGVELVLHVTDGKNCARCTFPSLQDGRTQVVVDEKDCLFALITDVDSEIYIQ